MRSTTTATALSKRIVTPPAAVGSKGLASELPLSALGLHRLSDEPVRRGAALARHGHGIAGSDRAKRLPIDTGGIHDDRATVGSLELQLGHANGFDRPLKRLRRRHARGGRTRRRAAGRRRARPGRARLDPDADDLLPRALLVIER